MIQAKAESASKRYLKDNETAEDIRKKAMESLKRPRNAIQTKVELLQNVVNRDVQNHTGPQRLTAKLDRRSYVQKQKEQQMMRAMVLQQQQMNTAFFTVVEKLLNK